MKTSLVFCGFVFLPAAAIATFGLVGGMSDTTVSPTYEPVVFAVEAAKAKLAQNYANSGSLTLQKIVHARTQVVAGQKLFLTLLLSNDFVCNVTVWYRAWLQGENRTIITDGPNCEQPQVPARVARTGGISHHKPLSLAGNDEPLLAALRFGACAASKGVNSPFAYVLGDDTSGVTYTKQVTAGTTYKFYNVSLLPTMCRKGPGDCASLDTAACANSRSPGLHPQRCHFTVQSRLWMPTPHSLSSVVCMDN